MAGRGFFFSFLHSQLDSSEKSSRREEFKLTAASNLDPSWRNQLLWKGTCSYCSPISHGRTKVSPNARDSNIHSSTHQSSQDWVLKAMALPQVFVKRVSCKTSSCIRNGNFSKKRNETNKREEEAALLLGGCHCSSFKLAPLNMHERDTLHSIPSFKRERAQRRYPARSSASIDTSWRGRSPRINRSSIYAGVENNANTQ